MLVIPAIDLKNGKCVRLLQGEEGRETVYQASPVEMALRFAEAGAQRLHLVDLDGAFRGATANLAGIEAVVRAVSFPVELGGGMRRLEDIEGMLALGVAAVVVGTMAVKSPDLFQEALRRFGGERVLLGIDAREGRVAVAGWQESTSLDDVEFALHWRDRGVTRVIYTDIARDGMLTGPNLEALRRMAEGSGLPLTASGGVSGPEDLEALRGLSDCGVDSVIVGKAIYEGKLPLSHLKPT